MIERPPGDLWVFAYGSLMWRPDFRHVESVPAVIHGYHRALCIYSIEYRGTYQRPGLVFGLDRGGACRGMAFRIAEADAKDAMAYLWDREMVTGVYRPRWLATRLGDGRCVKVWSFVAEREHDQYTGPLDDGAVIELILQGHGKAGHCLAYLRNTLDHLEQMGIHDRALHRIVNRAEQAQNRKGKRS